MTSTLRTTLRRLALVGALGAGLLVRIWLARRHVNHVLAHRETVPAAFAVSISADAHRKAADRIAIETDVDQRPGRARAQCLVERTLLDAEERRA